MCSNLCDWKVPGQKKIILQQQPHKTFRIWWFPGVYEPLRLQQVGGSHTNRTRPHGGLTRRRKKRISEKWWWHEGRMTFRVFPSVGSICRTVYIITDLCCILKARLNRKRRVRPFRNSRRSLAVSQCFPSESRNRDLWCEKLRRRALETITSHYLPPVCEQSTSAPAGRGITQQMEGWSLETLLQMSGWKEIWFTDMDFMGLSSSKWPHLLNLQGFIRGSVIGQKLLTKAGIMMCFCCCYCFRQLSLWKKNRLFVIFFQFCCCILILSTHPRDVFTLFWQEDVIIKSLLSADNRPCWCFISSSGNLFHIM